MKDPEFICDFAVTLGAEFDILIRLTAGQSLAGLFFMDAAGSVLIENFAHQAELKLILILRIKLFEICIFLGALPFKGIYLNL